jgi:hypothetical protein
MQLKFRAMYALYQSDPCAEGADEYLKKSFEKIQDAVDRVEHPLFKIQEEILKQLGPGVKEEVLSGGEVRPSEPDELEIHIPSGVPSNVYFIDREFLKSTYLDTTNIDDQLKSLKNLSRT